MTRFPKLSRRKLRLAIRITVSQADRGTKGGTGGCAGCSPLLASSLPIWMADSKISSTSFQSSNARRASCFGAENPGGAFGRSVGARLPCARHRGQPWRERPRDLTASAIVPATTVEVAHATVEWCHRIRRRAQTAPQGTQVLMAFRGGPPRFPERLPTLVFRFRLGNG